jgi:hypothetical protein
MPSPKGRSPYTLIFATLLALFALVAIVGANSGNDDHSVVMSVADSGAAAPRLI